VAEIIRKLGISEQTFYRWKKRFAGLGIAELRRLRILEEENGKLKQLVADLSLDKKMLQDVLSKKLCGPRSSVFWCGRCRWRTGLPNVEPVGCSGFPERLPLPEQA